MSTKIESSLINLNSVDHWIDQIDPLSKLIISMYVHTHTNFVLCLIDPSLFLTWLKINFEPRLLDQVWFIWLGTKPDQNFSDPSPSLNCSDHLTPLNISIYPSFKLCSLSKTSNCRECNPCHNHRCFLNHHR